MCTFPGSLDEVLTDAILKDKVKFMELILQQGVFMKEFLTVDRMENLYSHVSLKKCYATKLTSAEIK